MFFLDLTVKAARDHGVNEPLHSLIVVLLNTGAATILEAASPGKWNQCRSIKSRDSLAEIKSIMATASS
jgi:hypothetical protein